MVLLVTDTSGKHGSVALARSDAEAKVELIESSPLAVGTFSAQLVPQIARLLGKHGLSKADVGAFIVISGPGSFTGLRVGLAAIKALAEILDKPIVPVSLLEVIAVASGRRGKILCALDAGRGETFVGEYDLSDSTALANEHLMSRDQFLRLAREATAISPDEDLAMAGQEQGIMVHHVQRPDAAMVATVGLRKLLAGVSVSPEQLEANYIRRSDAEIFAKSSL